MPLVIRHLLTTVFLLHLATVAAEAQSPLNRLVLAKLDRPPIAPRIFDPLISPAEMPEPEEAEEVKISVYPPPPALPSARVIPESERRRLIAELASENISEISTAERGLLRGGPATLAALTAAANAHFEQYAEVVPDLLERLVRSGDSETARAAEQALIALSKSDNSVVRNTATECLELSEVARSQRAIANVRKLGGLVNLSRGFYDIDDRTGEYYRSVAYVALDDRWQGGESGLDELLRISSLRLLIVVDGSDISPAKLEEMKQAQPFLITSTRPKVTLGLHLVWEAPNFLGVQVNALVPGGTAARAGLKAGDAIRQFGDKEIFTSQELLDCLYKRVPGDVVEIRYVREEQGEEREHTVKVILQGWTSNP